MGRPGVEPGILGLKVQSSNIVLAARQVHILTACLIFMITSSSGGWSRTIGLLVMSELL